MTASGKSSLSLLATLTSVVLAGILVHQLASGLVAQRLESAVVTASEAANQDLTLLFINDLYDAIEPAVRLSSDITQQNNALSPEEYARINGRIREFMLGTDFLKIKLYNLRGTTLYSSDPNQLGADYSANPGFKAAMRGGSYSVSELRSEFGGYSGVVYDRDVVSSYVPVRRSVDGANAAGRIIGVAEIYADRTEEMNAVRASASELSFMLALAMFLVLVVIVGAVWYLSLSMTERYIRDAEESKMTDRKGGLNE